ncbi:MAG: hypothetical protein M1817_003365 [Caeruleum heppii]|nr:MAG: hypothetical protein M1817_003365 [Caeruleum heppii]
MQHLNELAAGTTASHHLVALLDQFYHQGPNGRHLCLVLEPMGPSVAAMVDELPSNQPRRFGHTPTYPGWMAKRILTQALQGLKFMHQHGIAQADFQQGNILFSTPDLDSIPEEDLQQGMGRESVSKPVRRRDGKGDRWAPRYLANSKSLSKYADIGPDFNIKLSDFGEAAPGLLTGVLAKAFNISDPPKGNINVPVGLRAPELIVHGAIDEKIDIWSFGCLIFELLVGHCLFSTEGYQMNQECEDDHLLQITELLGDLPDKIFSRWSHGTLYFGPNRERIRWELMEETEGPPDPSLQPDDQDDPAPWDISDEEDDKDRKPRSPLPDSPPAEDLPEAGHFDFGVHDDLPNEFGARPPLEEYFKTRKPKYMSDEEASVVLSLLRQCLQLDSADRPTATQLLQHPFFSLEFGGAPK